MLLTVAWTALTPTRVHADNTIRGWNGFAGIHRSSEQSALGAGGSSSISSPIMVGLRLWQRLGERAAVEAELPVSVTDSRDQVATLFVTMPRVQGRLSFLRTPKVTPSAVLGAGLPIVTSTKQSAVPSDIAWGAYAGAALDLRLKGLHVGVEARYVAVPASGESFLAHEWEVLLSFGLSTSAELGRAPVARVVVRPPDSDRDGVPDSEDQCPGTREDLDDFEDEDGCPELDNDDDGVIDGLDECQREAETFNGFEDDDGCADELTEEVRLLEGGITGLRFDGGSGVMEEDSGQEELHRLVQVLRDNPSVKIEAIGHADDQEGRAEELEALAQERADSVRELLIEMGVAHGRIYSIGRGAMEPFADNRSSSGRRANRRVEIRIFRRNRGEAPTP